MDSAEAVTHVSLCAGYGGIDLGLKRAIANLRTIAFSEIEAFAIANLVAKMEAGQLDAAPVWTDLKTFPWHQFRGKVDILSTGYPCQPFSAAGLRRGADDPRHLWPFIADGISRMQPAFCFFENVEGHISLGLRDVLRDLGSRGYTATWGIFSAAEVGAPHQRKRVFILAHSSSIRRREDYWFRKSKFFDETNAVWPSRPGQPQHGWEPPRVVEDATLRGGFNARGKGRDSQQEGQPRDIAKASYGVGYASSVQRDGGDDNSGSSERSEAVPQPRNAGGEGAVGDAKCNGWSASNRDSTAMAGAKCEKESGESKSGATAQATDGSGSVVGDAEELRRAGVVENSIKSTYRTQVGFDKTDAQDTSRSTSRFSGSGKSVGDADCWGQSPSLNTGSSCEADRGGQGHVKQTNYGQAEPALGGNADGLAGGMGYAELCVSCDNRTDELRLLGNGVVPQTAELAFKTLLLELKNTHNERAKHHHAGD